MPDLLVLALAHTTHFNVVYEDYVSGFLLIATAVLLIVAHRRRSPSTPWIYYFPVAIVLLSLNQGTMTLWGFAVSWYLEIFALAVALFLLDRVSLGWLGLVGAVAVTVAGAFSSLEGLLIWPVGLLLLYHRRRSRAAILVWITAAVLTTGLYMFHFDFTTAGTGTKSFVLTHPLTAARFFFFAIGDVFGVQLPGTPSAGDYFFCLLGVLIFAVAAWVLIVGLPRRDRSTGSPIGVAMVLFGVLYTMALTEGRGSLGLSVLPRYAIFELLILAGCYLAVLDGSLFEEREGRIARIGRCFSVAGVIRRLEGPGGAKLGPADGGWWFRMDHIGIRAALHRRPLPSSTDRTLRGHQCCRRLAQSRVGRHRHRRQHQPRPESARPGGARLVVATSFVCSEHGPGGKVRSSEPVRHGGGDVLQQTGTLCGQDSTHHTRAIIPSGGSSLTGTSGLIAKASDPYGIKQVTFILTGGSVHNMVIGRAHKTIYGWAVSWSTSRVPNGTYEVRSVAYSEIGTSSHSAEVQVTVRN